MKYKIDYEKVLLLHNILEYIWKIIHFIDMYEDSIQPLDMRYFIYDISIHRKYSQGKRQILITI